MRLIMYGLNSIVTTDQTTCKPYVSNKGSWFRHKENYFTPAALSDGMPSVLSINIRTHTLTEYYFDLPLSMFESLEFCDW